MSRRHREAGWTAAKARRAAARIKAGPAVQPCNRCGKPITIADRHTWDIGHIVDVANGGDLNRYAPECRHCNRSAGGRAGALITNRTSRSGAERLPDW